MLTLKELKKIVKVADMEKRIPSVKSLKEHKVVVKEKADRFTERQKEKEAQVAKTEKVGKEQPDQKPKTKKHDMEL